MKHLVHGLNRLVALHLAIWPSLFQQKFVSMAVQAVENVDIQQPYASQHYWGLSLGIPGKQSE